jgi:hypothetical protein
VEALQESVQAFGDLPASDIAHAMRVFADATALDASSPESLRASVDALAARHAGEALGMNDVRHLVERALTMESARRLARVALAARAHRDATGAWPASLEELAPALGGAVPTDPATGRAFEVVVDGTAVRFRAARAEGDDDAALREKLLLWEFPR